MPTISTTSDFLELVYKSGLLTAQQVSDAFDSDIPENPNEISNQLVKAGLLTHYQSRQLLAGKARGFFLGPYKILQPLGSGGMGMVFLAMHTSLDRKVAIKVLTAAKANDKLTFERFQREARSSAALDHPNIVHLHDINQGNGVHFLVMEYVDGNDLQTLMSKTGPLHYAQAAQYIAQAAVGLKHAHSKGFIHRDIKPANLMLSKEGIIKILDMGLARSFSNAKDNLTENLGDGEITGTVDYISPEQAMNHPLDERSDIYSLGVTFFALLTGHPPYDGTTAQKLMQHQSKDPKSLAKKLNGRAPQPLMEIIFNMIAKKPHERYQTAEDVIDALGPWLPTPTTGNIVQDPITTSSFNLSTKRSGANFAKPSTSAKWLQVILPLCKQRPVQIGAGLFFLVLCLVWIFSGSSETTEPKNTSVVDSTKSSPTEQAVTTILSPLSKGKVVYQLNCKGVEPFRFKGTWQSTSDDSLMKSTGWFANIYREDTTGEFCLEMRGGQPVLGVQCVEGSYASQLAFRPNEVGLDFLKPGRQYRVHMEYRTEKNARVLSKVQVIGTWEPLMDERLAASDKWRVTSLPFTVPSSGNIQFVFAPDECHGKMVWLRRFEIEDLTSNSPNPSLAKNPNRLYSVNFSTVPVASKTINSPGRSIVLTDFGNGNLPGGIAMHHWNGSTSAEYSVADFAAARALGIRSLSGSQGVQAHFPCEKYFNWLAEGDKCVVRLTYANDGSRPGSMFVEYRVDPYPKYSITELPPTAGQWKTVELTFQRPVETGDYEFVVVAAKDQTGADGTIWIQSVDVLQPNTAQSAAKGEIFRLAAADLPLFRNNKQGTKVIEGDQPSLGKGVYFYGHKEDTVSEYFCDIVDGQKALGWYNLSGPASSQISVELELPMGESAAKTPMTVGQKYRAQVTYKTVGGANGQMHLQTQKTYQHVSGASVALSDTNGQWKTVDMQWTKPKEPIRLLIDHQSEQADAILYVREVVVSEANQSQVTSVSKTIFDLNLSNQKLFTDRGHLDKGNGNWRWVSDMKTGEGDLPLGWNCFPWLEESIVEKFADNVTGRKAIGIRGIHGQGCAMLLTPYLSFMTRSLRITFEYQTDSDVKGITLRFKPSKPKDDKAFDVYRLEPTNGAWRTVSMDVDLKGSTNGFLEFHNLAVGAESSLRIGTLKINELISSSNP